jgi:hypothetical protein
VVCSSCFNCLKTSLHKISDGTAPSDVAIDLNRVLDERSDWSPADDGENRSSVGSLYGERMNQHLVRVLRELDADRIAEFAPGGELTEPALAGLDRLRATAFAASDPPPEPGYRAAYLELLDESLCDGMNDLLSEHFEEEPLAEYEQLLENTLVLSDWIAAPLGRTQVRVGSSPSPA